MWNTLRTEKEHKTQFWRIWTITLAFNFAASALASAQTASPAPSPTPDPLSVGGLFRSYYFTRQNASNNPGVRFDASSAKYSSAGVNQVSWNNAIELHADYHFAGGQWYAGGSYFYANPVDGPCTPAVTHAKGQPCVAQRPPNTNPDDTLPGFALSTFTEAYLGFTGYGVSGKIGDQLFSSPWAASYDGSRMKSAAYQGADVKYALHDGWTFEAADMIQFENRTSSTFDSSTMLTSHPAGAAGMASNIYVPAAVASIRVASSTRLPVTRQRERTTRSTAISMASRRSLPFGGSTESIRSGGQDGSRFSHCRAASRRTLERRISGRSIAPKSAYRSELRLTKGCS